MGKFLTREELTASFVKCGENVAAKMGVSTDEFWQQFADGYNDVAKEQNKAYANFVKEREDGN